MNRKNIVQILFCAALFLAGMAGGLVACRLHGGLHPSAVPALADGAASDSAADTAESEGAGLEAVRLRIYDAQVQWFDGVRWNDGGSVEALSARDPVAQDSDAWRALAAQLADARAEERKAALAALRREDNGLFVDQKVVPRYTSSSRPATSAGGGAPVASTPAPSVPDPSPSATGDGEDIVWSGNYE